ncbi:MULTISPECIES: phage baseplate protein [unclassified Leclercia]|uniref:Dit-like phage tail protein N-terminal domain-containing protein n=1 Tax=Leclercia barmai TaxID=2785629 RepID=A0ABS7RT17_9ENTR|nr:MULTISPECIES: hypothetical protein [unclassified Leclercia]MBZ0057450.1 hypothetical protein [Leclercia sp. EMC7]MCM5695614.1 hypothetical protein [Leclercia sp. LTM01]MCM5700022.1 hypothetical protein [Leclercia sp. LTM14]
MATGLPGYNVTPMNYTGQDGILFHLKDDMSVFLKLSATTDITYNSPMEATTQPVQTGQVVTDNIQEKPNTIQINGVVVVSYEGAFLTKSAVGTVEDFVTTLQRWRQQRQVLRVLAKDGITLENALCTNFEAKKDSKIANGLNISLTFQDANFVVQVGQTEAPNANGSGSGKNVTGKATTKNGAVTSMKDAGNTGTKAIKPGNCSDVRGLYSTGQKVPGLDLVRAWESCERGSTYNKTTGKVVYNESGLKGYVKDNPYQAQAGNITKQSTH